MATVRPAEPQDDAALARLFAQYHEAFRYHLGNQDVTGEGRRAREAYRNGALLVAEGAGGVVGCSAYEPWGPGRARMKRMVVDPDHRGQGVGRRLAEGIMAAARAAGYREMCLDTVPPMEAARALYASLGFTPFEPDYEAPCRDTLYMRRAL